MNSLAHLWSKIKQEPWGERIFLYPAFLVGSMIGLAIGSVLLLSRPFMDPEAFDSIIEELRERFDNLE